MKAFAVSVLFACVCVVLVLADSPKPRFSPKAPFNDPTDRATIKQIEQEMGDAIVAVDIEKLNQIYADDFSMLGSSGKIITKQSILQQVSSGKYKLESYELGPIDVQALGNVAVCHGAVTEKRIADGKDVHVELVYMDRFEKRAGKWLLVSSDSGFPK
jgi:ketosteroid isomerase-like protein